MTNLPFDPDRISALIDSCAQAHVMPRFRALAAHEIKTKTGPDDLVTQADIDMERALEAALIREVPGTRLLGEEGVAEGRVTLDLLREPETGIWVVDPIDGTYNFSHGSEKFGTLLAFVQDGRTLAGWIYDAPRRAATVAVKGRGVRREGGGPFALSQTGRLAEAVGSVGLKYFPKETAARLESRLAAACLCDSIRANCAAHQYLGFVEGRIDFAIHNRGQPWDHLAGMLAVEELGGVARTWEGRPYNPAAPSHILIANGQALWDEVREKILEGV